MVDVVVVGAGSQARYVVETARHLTDLSVLGMVDVESGGMVGSIVNGVEVLCHLDDLAETASPDSCRLVVAYGDNRRKRDLVEAFSGAGYRFASVVSPAAYVSSPVALGEGCIINPNVTIMPNARIGDHAVIHSGCVIEHDNDIGRYANIAPGVSFGGNVTVAEGAWVYTGSSVIPRVRIGRYAVVGAGSVVIRDVPDGARVAGCPARLLPDC